MSAPHAFTLLGPRATVDAALCGVDLTRERAQVLLAEVAALGRQDAALALRIGMVLAWVKRQDASVLGYSSFTAFCRAKVEWSDSWMRDVVRLVESPLDLVKAAAARDLVPLRVAVKAPGRVAVEEQAAWLLDPRVDAPLAGPRERFDGDDAEVIRRARRLARLCLGRSASERAVDEHIVACWRDRVPAEAILAAARERPCKPEWEHLRWGWCEGAPAEALVGPWAEPVSVDEAAARIEALEALRRGRAAVLARAWSQIDYLALWAPAGFESGWEFAHEVLGWSRRTAQRNKRVGWALEWYPALDRAIAEGLDLGSVALLAGVVSTVTVERWVAVAQRVDRAELQRAIDATWVEKGVIERYEQAIADADAGAPSAGGPPPAHRPRVALPGCEGVEPASEVRGPRDLAVAARWFVENVHVEPQRGFGKVKERDGYRCQNPECGRVSLRAEAHHIQPRSLGGSDEPSNGVTVCRACHLRGIHTADGRICVDRVAVRGREALWWRYPGGRSVLAFRDGR